jgi:FAD/FMN-containing dehydrogenase
MQRVSQLGEQVVRDLTDAAGEGGIIADAAQLAPFLRDWRGLYQGSAPLLLQPSTTAAAARIVSVCARHRIGIVPQGGNTGLVGGAVPDSTDEHPQILLSTARLRAIRQIDPDNYTITAEAGCVLGALQAAAERADRLFPLSLAAEGSCQLGGNISTNAGGTAVLRYGTTRDLVLGLEVVLPDGRVYEGLRGLRKDNTGYDLKQLFIGAEGTLGLITAATCKLFPRYSSIATAFAAVPDVDAAIALHRLARQRLGEDLTTFEFMDRRSLDLVVRHIPGCRNPLDAAYGWYVLIETAPVRAAADADGGDVRRCGC